MTRAEFTEKLATLLSVMTFNGAKPIIDHALRSREEQQRLYELGRTKCDGVIKLSQHQKGLAVDIYFFIDGQIDFGYNTQEAKDLSKTYHDLWHDMGGSPVISWDLPHYEMR